MEERLNEAIEILKNSTANVTELVGTKATILMLRTTATALEQNIDYIEGRTDTRKENVK